MLPISRSMYKAMTRPRMSGRVASCRVELAADISVIIDAPTAAQANRATTSTGAAAAASMLRPSMRAPPLMRWADVRPLPAAASDPIRAPTPIPTDSRP